MQATVYLIRHAQPQSHTLNGSLTEKGITQAKKIAAHLRKIIAGKQILTKKPLLIVSPTTRTRETADWIAKALHLHPITHSVFSENYLVDSKVSFISPTFLMHHVATSRICRAFWHIIRANPNRTIIIVTHGNVIRVLCGKLLHKTYEEMSQIPVLCGSITTVTVKDTSASITNYDEL